MKIALPSLFQNKRVAVPAVVVLLVIAVVFYFELQPRQHYLTITTTPAPATIYIDGEYAGVGSVQKRLIEGRHTITTDLEGYETSEKTIALSNTTALEIPLVLREVSEPLTSIEKFGLISPVIAQNGLTIGINRYDSLLYEYTKTSVTNIHDKPVASFSYQHPNVVLIEQRNSRDFVIINLQTKEKRRVSLRTLEPLVSVGLIPNTNSVFFLARLDTDARTTSLFISDLSFLSPKEIATTKATGVEGISPSKALLYEEADAEDASRVVIIDVEVGKEVLRIAANDFIVSPNKTFVFIQDSKQLTLHNIETQVSVRLPVSGERAYKPFFSVESAPMVIVNKATGPVIESLDASTLQTLTTIPLTELGTTAVSSIIGAKEGLLVLIDSNNKVWQIALP